MWLENRRVTEILHDIETRALRLRDARAPDPRATDMTMAIDAAAPQVTLPMERPLYAPVRKPPIDSSGIHPAGKDDETDPTVLFEQVYVDPGPLRSGIRLALRRDSQVGLADILAAAPLTQGLAELVTYLSMKDEAFRVVYDEAHTEQVSWTNLDGQVRTATLPRVTFTRSA